MTSPTTSKLDTAHRTFRRGPARWRRADRKAYGLTDRSNGLPRS